MGEIAAVGAIMVTVFLMVFGLPIAVMCRLHAASKKPVILPSSKTKKLNMVDPVAASKIINTNVKHYIDGAGRCPICLSDPDEDHERCLFPGKVPSTGFVLNPRFKKLADLAGFDIEI